MSSMYAGMIFVVVMTALVCIADIFTGRDDNGKND